MHRTHNERRMTGAPAATSVPWDMDGVDAADVRQTYEDIARFVEWLRTCDVTVPTCWYAHGWVVWRLAALQAWQQAAYLPDAAAREAVDWWLVGVEPLRRDWEDLIAHRGRHTAPDSPLHEAQPVPPLDEVIASLVAERRTEEGPR
jgi:hypothetical protein